MNKSSFEVANRIVILAENFGYWYVYPIDSLNFLLLEGSKCIKILNVDPKITSQY